MTAVNLTTAYVFISGLSGVGIGFLIGFFMGKNT